MYIPFQVIYRFYILYKYKHACTWFRHVCTVLPNPVQVVRIPDVDIEVLKVYIEVLDFDIAETSISKYCEVL